MPLKRPVQCECLAGGLPLSTCSQVDTAHWHHSCVASGRSLSAMHSQQLEGGKDSALPTSTADQRHIFVSRMRMSSKQTPVTGSCIVHNVIACLRDGCSTQRMERRPTGSMYAEWHNDIPVHHKGILRDQWASLWRQILAEDSPCVCKFKLSRHTCRRHSWHRLDTENRHVWHGPLPLLSHVASCTSAYT